MGVRKKSPIKTLKVKKIYKNPWLSLEEHKVIEHGKEGIYGVVDYGDGVSILATSDKNIYMIKEYKYAIKDFTFQLPSGSVDVGETPLQSAKKELFEEAGLKAGGWKHLGITHPFPTNITTTVHLFLADNVRKVKEPEKGTSLYKFTVSEVKKLIEENKVTHSGSLVTLLKYLSQR